MKRLAMLLLALIMLLSLVACGEETTDDVGATTSTTEPSTSTQPPHTHSYTSKVTAEANCTTEGTKTFSCACGDTYTEAIPSHHTWSDWQVETYAMVGKPGTEIRTCSVCSASESQERTANAIANSFYDTGLVYFGRNDTCRLTGPGLVYYAVNAFPEFRDTPVMSKTLFGKLMDYFPVPEQLMSDAKYWGAMTGLYNEDDDTFTIAYNTSEIEDGKLTILGYIHRGENEYAVYFQCNNGIEDRFCEFVMEYHRLDGEPNYYVSSKIVDQLPADMINCADDERYELAD